MAAAHRQAASLQNRPPPGDCNPGSGDVAALVGRQKDINRCELGGLARPAQRSVLAERCDLPGGVDGISGVQIGPGATLLTRMPLSPSNCARLADRLAMAAFKDSLVALRVPVLLGKVTRPSRDNKVRGSQCPLTSNYSVLQAN